MTTYNVEYKFSPESTHTRVQSFDDMLQRALWLIGMGSYVVVVRQWQGTR